MSLQVRVEGHNPVHHYYPDLGVLAKGIWLIRKEFWLWYTLGRPSLRLLYLDCFCELDRHGGRIIQERPP